MKEYNIGFENGEVVRIDVENGKSFLLDYTDEEVEEQQVTG